MSKWRRQPTTDTGHPYAVLAPAAVPVVSSHDQEEDDECPVCLEPLSFSFRLPGEKPHIVPECGHALHEACFAAVYGPLPSRVPGAAPAARKTSLGVCGVCRRPMRVEGDSGGGKSNKLAALTGMGGRDSSMSLYPGRDTPQPLGHPHNQGGPGRNLPNGSPGISHPVRKEIRGPNDDDPLERPGSSMKSGSGHGHAHGHHGRDVNSTYVVTPSIQARSEFTTITRTAPSFQPPNSSNSNNSDANSLHSHGATSVGNKDGTTQPLTCIVVVELPSRRSSPHQLPGQVQPSDPANNEYRPPPYASNPNVHVVAEKSIGSVTPSNGPTPTPSSQHLRAVQNVRRPGVRRPSNASSRTSRSDCSSEWDGRERYDNDRYDLEQERPDDPFRATIEDLRTRIIDWKGHSLAGLGPLQLYDHLHVRREQLLREFFVYLFREALICVIEEKKRGFPRLLPDSYSSQGINSSKGVLRLKGRIFVRHIRNVTDTSVHGELSLTIDMEDEKLDSFILIFKERGSLETWRNKIQMLVTNERARKTSSISTRDTMSSNGTMEEFGGRVDALPPGVSGKAARMLSGNSGTTSSSAHSSARTDGSSLARNTVSSATTASSYSGDRHHGKYNGSAGMGMIEEDSGYGEPNTPLSNGSNGYIGSPGPQSPMPSHGSVPHSPNSALVAPHISSGPSNSLPSLPHTPMDILLILSVPPATAPRSTAQLKIRVLKTTLDFVLASLGAHDRISIVTFEIGVGGRVRRTPFLRVGGNGDGGVRLKNFADTIGNYPEEDPESYGTTTREKDGWEVKTGKEEKTDVVTAVNHGLDVVLQRKQRNPISSILLVSDAADSARRAQMDLVLARAEAANIAIHSFGYGRSHDPASLWLMSNHTSGTYTFVKEWYDLRDCIAGCLGGMMSVATLNTKLHLKVVDGNRFKIRKVSGVGNSIVSSDGRDVDVDLGELRYGEKKEMLVELDLDNSDDFQRLQAMASMGGAYGGNNGGGSFSGRSSRRALNGTDQFMQRMGLDALSLQDSNGDLMDGMMEGMIDEVPVFELDGSYYDPAAMKTVSRLAHPVLLTVTLLPPSTPASSRPRTPNNGPSDPVIVRRRMELFASDMITRALVLVSKKSYPQAHKILYDTRRILNTALQNITQGLSPSTGATGRNRREMLVLQAVRTLQSIHQDVQVLSEALDENVEGFAFDQRNFGAQQAMILRDQKCWSGRTATERLFFSVDNAIELVSRSTDWVSSRE